MLGPGINQNDLKILKELSYVAGLRGQDGTGIVQGRFENFNGDREQSDRWNKYKIAKSAHDISFFQWYSSRHKEGDKELFNGIYNNFFAVHVRAATQGAICKENSHPFEFDNIIGMHNGTLQDRKYDDLVKTDSELLIKDLDEKNFQSVLESLHPYSAYALVILDKHNGIVHFIRNKDRTLYCCYNAKRAVMYWASEKWMLDGVLHRNGEQLFNNTVYNVEPNKIHSIEISEFKAGTEKVFDNIVEFTPRVVAHKNNDNKYSQNWGRISWGYTPPEKKEENLSSIMVDGKKDNVIHVNLLPGPRTIPKLRVSGKIPYGICVDCKKKLNLVDQFFAKKFPLEPTLFVCKECEPPFEPKLIETETEVKIG